MRGLRRLFPLLLLLAVFAAGLVAIVRLRLGAGDVFPNYSSYRADPIGTRLLNDSLKTMPGLRVERSLERVEKLGTRPARTIIMAGMSPARWARLRPEAINSLDAAVRGGSRLVVVFEASSVNYLKPRRLPYDADLPSEKTQKAKKTALDSGKTESEGKKAKPVDDKQAARELLAKDKRAQDSKGTPESDSSDKKPEAPGKTAPDNGSDYKDDEDYEAPEGMQPGASYGNWEGMNLFRKLWGVDLYGRMLLRQEIGAVRSPQAPEGFPPGIRWHSCSYLVFSKGSPWRVLYTRSEQPVMAELQHGAGSIVLATDAYCVSNEALQEAPPVSVLSWLVGGSDTVIFDEAHLGLRRDKGLAMLARRYGLLPAMLLLLLAGLLYVWRQSSRFIPPPAEAEELALEFHPTAGLEALLRRAVPADKLYETCVAEWRRHARPADQARIQNLPTGRGAAAYNAALAALRRVTRGK